MPTCREVDTVFFLCIIYFRSTNLYEIGEKNPYGVARFCLSNVWKGKIRKDQTGLVDATFSTFQLLLLYAL